MLINQKPIKDNKSDNYKSNASGFVCLDLKKLSFKIALKLVCNNSKLVLMRCELKYKIKY